MPRRLWARLREDVDCGLRRGGWYEALAIEQGRVLLSIHGRQRTFPSQIFEVSNEGPSCWTVITRAGNSGRIPLRWRNGYAVCPSCHWRQLLLGRPKTLLCEGCYREFEVNWEENYLKAV